MQVQHLIENATWDAIPFLLIPVYSCSPDFHQAWDMTIKNWVSPDCIRQDSECLKTMHIHLNKKCVLQYWDYMNAVIMLIKETCLCDLLNIHTAPNYFWLQILIIFACCLQVAVQRIWSLWGEQGIYCLFYALFSSRGISARGRQICHIPAKLLVSNIVSPGVDNMCMLKLQLLNDTITEQITYIPGGHTARLLLNWRTRTAAICCSSNAKWREEIMSKKKHHF
jgi:hypothetical protein